MIDLHCRDVSSGWEDVGTPDDITVELELERTCHRFHPSLRELVLIYDAILHKRDLESPIGTGDYIEVNNIEQNQGLVELCLPPINTHVERNQFINSLENLIRNIFKEKSRINGDSDREEALDRIEDWVSERGAELNVEDLRDIN